MYIHTHKYIPRHSYIHICTYISQMDELFSVVVSFDLDQNAAVPGCPNVPKLGSALCAV